MWYPTIQFTCKIYNPRTKETIWRSVNVSNWSVGADKRSSKADEYSITLSSTPGADHPETYTIRANLPEELQILLEVRRPSAVPGFKVGKGPKGGYSYFGHDPEKADGYAVHRFWPRTENTGMLVYKGEVFNVKGPGMFIHAIQGMRPDNVAAAWDFANFQSDAHGGVSAMQMEFKTIDAYGRKGAGSGGVKVNVGAVVLGGKLAAVTAETRWPDEALAEDAVVKSRVQHLNPVLDPDTGYGQPTALAYEWAGPSIVADAPGAIEAKLVNEVGTPSAPNGLIDKVDVLAEIPQVIKMVVNYVSGTKPFMYMVRDCDVRFHPAVSDSPIVQKPGKTGGERAG